jgi:hypothetical protein
MADPNVPHPHSAHHNTPGTQQLIPDDFWEKSVVRIFALDRQIKIEDKSIYLPLGAIPIPRT